MIVFLVGGESRLMDALITKMEKDGHKTYLLTGKRDGRGKYRRVFERYNFPYDSESVREIFTNVNPDLVIFLGAYDTNYDWSVDMSSWGGSACYPRSTFYPLSDGVSIHIRRITMPQFPACSACLPPSQAPLCHCTLLGRLPIGPRAPLEASVTLLEATTPVKLPTKQCPRISELDLRQPKGRISRMAPQRLATPLQSLRPILHIG